MQKWHNVTKWERVFPRKCLYHSISRANDLRLNYILGMIRITIRGAEPGLPTEPGQGFSCQYATSHYYTGRTRAGIQLSVGYITPLHRQNPDRDSAVSMLHHTITPAEPGQGFSCQ